MHDSGLGRDSDSEGHTETRVIENCDLPESAAIVESPPEIIGDS